jgi:hypothetical protein
MAGTCKSDGYQASGRVLMVWIVIAVERRLSHVAVQLARLRLWEWLPSCCSCHLSLGRVEGQCTYCGLQDKLSDGCGFGDAGRLNSRRLPLRSRKIRENTIHGDDQTPHCITCPDWLTNANCAVSAYFALRSGTHP